ncbi:hypothetical protein [Stappia sp. ES.058]|uniref:hypothetical protein n=1 Tax=Stappia sp. ES.058 TaxID=1881061 RepID=UPI00087C2AEE|nr:hypothetical protein [Stappia sp. ES.058]SDT96014.1 hypothetical protein SAMN05428979_0733 [Stappia sp. ES.058]
MTATLHLLDSLTHSGAIALIALCVLTLELAVIALAIRDTALRRSLLLNGLSGIALMMALYLGLAGRGGALLIALCLAASLAAHLLDLMARLRPSRIG